MKLHYNSDGTIFATINFKGKKISMTFGCEEDYQNFILVFF